MTVLVLICAIYVIVPGWIWVAIIAIAAPAAAKSFTLRLFRR